MDYEAVAAELLRALRGRRSQVAVARRLGYRSNVIYSWESGRTFPTAAKALRMAAGLGVDVQSAFESFHRGPHRWMTEVDSLTSAEAVVAFLGALRGPTKLTTIAETIGRSRYAVARWLQGTAEPRLPDFLRLVDAMSLRALELVGCFVDPAQLPSARDEWSRVQALKQAAFDAPWSAAILRVVELSAYRALPRHEEGWIARRLGIELATEREAVALLVRTGQLRWDRGKLSVGPALAVDARRDPTSTRRMRAFWTEVARDRLEAGVADAVFSYNVFAVSAADHERLRALHRAYFQELRAIVAQSEPPERVLLAAAQLVPLA